MPREQVLLTGVRIIKPYLDQMSAYDEKARPSFNASFLVEKGSDNAKLLLAAAKRVAEAMDLPWTKESVKTGKKVAAAWRKDKQRFVIRDGDNEEDEAVSKYDSNKGCWVFRAKNYNGRPALLNRASEVVSSTEQMSPEGLKGGDYVRVSVNVTGFDYKSNLGVTCYLNAVQFLRSGEALGPAVDLSGFVPEGPDDDDE
jgi:hypothetical protein